MIGRLSGQLITKNPPKIVVDCHGVGYEIDVPMSTFYGLPVLGQPVVLLTHFLVREDVQQLFGFATESERGLFRLLIKISGVGARTALSILSGLSSEELSSAVIHQQIGPLTRIPGIGKKTAERLLLELRNRFDPAQKSGLFVGMSVPVASALHDIQEALLALGYSEKEMQSVTRDLPPDTDVSEGIRQALRKLSK